MVITTVLRPSSVRSFAPIVDIDGTCGAGIAYGQGTKVRGSEGIAYSFRIVALASRHFETHTEDAHLMSVPGHQIVAGIHLCG
jgi:hypothetical protein